MNQTSSIAKNLRKIVGEKKTITQITYLENMDYTDYWREITVHSTEATKQFIILIKKLEDIKSSESDLISRFKQFNQKKVEQKRISNYKMWEGLNITLSTILTMAMFFGMDETPNTKAAIKE